MTYIPNYVCNNILNEAFKRNLDVTPMKLQKLLYYVNGEYLKKTGDVMFMDCFMKWKYGPVLMPVYYEFQSFGANPITSYSKDAKGNSLAYDLSKNPILQHCINNVLNKYGGFTGVELSQKTHEDGGAWKAALDNGPITKDLLEKEFN